MKNGWSSMDCYKIILLDRLVTENMHVENITFESSRCRHAFSLFPLGRMEEQRMLAAFNILEPNSLKSDARLACTYSEFRTAHRHSVRERTMFHLAQSELNFKEHN